MSTLNGQAKSLGFSSIFRTTRWEQSETEVIWKPELSIDQDLAHQAKHYASIEQQVIVHCFYKNRQFDPRIRIWPSTFLKPKGSSEFSKLLSAVNISFYPEWTRVKPFSRHDFTLIFEALPKECTVFDLAEDIPEPGGFFASNIKRNELDVYHLEL
jgi:hypothetical protein